MVVNAVCNISINMQFLVHMCQKDLHIELLPHNTLSFVLTCLDHSGFQEAKELNMNNNT